MKRALVLFVLVLGAAVAHAQPVPPTWRPPICVTSGSVLTWNGTAFVCSSAAGITGTGTTNTVAKFTAASVLGNSLLTEDGTTLTYGAGKLTVASATGSTAIAGTLAVTSLTTATGGVTTPANLTTTGTGDLVSGDALTVAGLSTLTGGFTLGTDSSAASHKITNLTNGSSAQDAAAFGQIASGINAAVSGTTGTVAKFTGTNTIGNTTFPITDTGTLLTLGDSTTNDITTVNGRLSTTSDSTAFPGGNIFTYQGAAQTGDRYTLQVVNSGTYDATATARTVSAVRGECTASRSAGANNVECRGLYGTATGTQVNNALYTQDGNVALNVNSGSSLIGTSTTTGFSSGSPLFPSIVPKLEVLTGTGSNVDYSEAVIVRHSASGSNVQTRRLGLLLKLSTESSAGESAKDGGLVLESTSTFANAPILSLVTADVKRITLDNAGGVAIVQPTTSTTNALFVNAPGAASGVRVNNATTGNTVSFIPDVLVNPTSSYDTTASDIVHYGIRVTSAITESAGTNLLTQYGVNSVLSSGSDTNIALYGTASGAATNVALKTDSGNVQLNTTGGTAAFGFSTSTASAVSVTGASVFSSTNTSVNAVTSTANSAGGTVSTSALRGTNTSTYDTTSSTIEVYAVRGISTSSRLAGANSLTTVGADGEASGGQINIGVAARTTGAGNTNFGVAAQATGAGTTNVGGNFTATGATTNIALKTDAGDNYLNATNGNTGHGYASGASVPAKLAVTSSAQAFDVVSTSATTNASAITWTPVAGTTNSLAALTTTSNGTFDTTAGTVSDFAIVASATATRSTGANTLRNVALSATASGAQINVAVRTNDGDNNLNTISGSTGVGYAFASSLPAKFSVTSTSAVNLGDFLLTTSGATTTKTVLNLLSNGTVDTTAGVLGSQGLKSFVTSTRSAGANNLTNTSAWFSATNGQVNIALQTDDGAVYANTASGSFGVGYASAATLPAKLSVSGTLDTTGAATLNSTLTVGGASTTFGVGSTTHHIVHKDGTARPTLTNCGTGAAIVGNDASWKLTTGTTPGACTVTFNQAVGANASCTVTARDGTFRAYAVSTTAVSFTTVSASAVYDGECNDH